MPCRGAARYCSIAACAADILRALALGANAAMVGRAWLYGLGALGQQGVALALDIMGRELAVSLALTGCSDVRAANRNLLTG